METATTIAERIRSGRTTSEEVCLELLARLEAGASLNAVVAWNREKLLEAARQADAALREGRARGPLHGVPITLKDSHSVQGMVTTCGYPPLEAHVPDVDGTVAARLRAAGALIFGKSNVPTLCGTFQSENPIYGRTLHPEDPARTPGGSSGGAAAALAAGHTYLDIGSDLSGSARVPAHYCGVYAFKPTERRVSNFGHIPPLPGQPMHVRIMVSNGTPMARSLEDLELAFELIQGPDGRDTDVAPVPYRPEPAPALPALRIGVLPEIAEVKTSRAVSDLLRGLVPRIEAAGGSARVVEPPVDLVDLNSRRRALQSFGFAAINSWAGEPQPLTYADYAWALGERDRAIQTLEAFFQAYDLLICPVAQRSAVRHEETRTMSVDGEEVSAMTLAVYTAPFNYTGHPALVLPAGRDDEGLPLGIQLVGPRWKDERLLAMGRTLDGLLRRPDR